MKKLTLLIAILMKVQLANAQITFQKTFGGTGDDKGNSIQQTSDGGYIITGSTKSFGAGNADVYLIKTNVNGNTLWTKTFGGAGDDEGCSVQQTTDGGYIIAGWTNSFGAGMEDVYLIKTDANGDTLWTKTFGGPGPDIANSVQQTADGGYIVTGNAYSFGVFDADAYLIKTDANGNSVWSKIYGGAMDDKCYSVKQTTDGGYIITGLTYSYGAGNDDIYLIKTNSNGDTLWTKTFGGADGDEGYSVQQTTDGGYIIAGFTTSFGAGNYDVYLIKTDAIGDTLWTKTFGGTDYDVSYSVRQTSDGGYIITGETYSFGLGDPKAYLIKVNANGNSLWTKFFAGTNSNEFGRSVQQTADGGYILTGFTYSFGVGGWDVYLVKTDSLGNSGCNQGNPATIITAPATQVTSPATITNSPADIATIPATLIGSGCVVTTLCTSVGINEITTDNLFLISPNPSAGNFIISFERMIVKGNIEILNILGENVFTESIFDESKKEINIKNISDGIYFVKMFDGEKSYCKKLIVEHN